MTRITKQFNRRVHFRIATHVSIVKSHVYEKNIKILVRLMANTDRNTIEFYESWLRIKLIQYKVTKTVVTYVDLPNCVLICEMPRVSL
jgi:hypothetical protein